MNSFSIRLTFLHYGRRIILKSLLWFLLLGRRRGSDVSFDVTLRMDLRPIFERINGKLGVMWTFTVVFKTTHNRQTLQCSAVGLLQAVCKEERSDIEYNLAPIGSQLRLTRVDVTRPRRRNQTIASLPETTKNIEFISTDIPALI